MVNLVEPGQELLGCAVGEINALSLTIEKCENISKWGVLWENIEHGWNHSQPNVEVRMPCCVMAKSSNKYLIGGHVLSSAWPQSAWIAENNQKEVWIVVNMMCEVLHHKWRHFRDLYSRKQRIYGLLAFPSKQNVCFKLNIASQYVVW